MKGVMLFCIILILLMLILSGFNTIATPKYSYDMVIITKEEFSNSLQRLVDHKNTVGISTLVNDPSLTPLMGLRKGLAVMVSPYVD